MSNEIKGCGNLLNPNGSSARCGQAPHAFGPAGTKQFCQSCLDKHRTQSLEQALKSNALDPQIKVLNIQPGTVVVLSLNLDADNFEIAKAMAEKIRHAFPQENKLLVLQRPIEIQALDEAQMREIGWVRWEKVEPLVSCADLLADKLRRDAENEPNDDESAGMIRHAYKVDALVRQVKGTQPEMPL